MACVTGSQADVRESEVMVIDDSFGGQRRTGAHRNRAGGAPGFALDVSHTVPIGLFRDLP